MIWAIIDESTPTWRTGNDVLYSLGMVMVDDSNVARTRARILAAINRRNPFHWERDRGPVVRRSMIDAIIDESVDVCLAAAVATADQEATRQRLLSNHLLPLAVMRDVAGIIIESRTNRDNSRDAREIRTWYRSQRARCPTIAFASKDEPLTWVADAVSGLWSDVLLNRATGPWLSDVAQACRLIQATWLGD